MVHSTGEWRIYGKATQPPRGDAGETVITLQRRDHSHTEPPYRFHQTAPKYPRLTATRKINFSEKTEEGPLKKRSPDLISYKSLTLAHLSHKMLSFASHREGNNYRGRRVRRKKPDDHLLTQQKVLQPFKNLKKKKKLINVPFENFPSH